MSEPLDRVLSEPRGARVGEPAANAETAGAVASPRHHERQGVRAEVLWRVREVVLLAIACLLFAFFALFANHFLDTSNLLGTARQAVIVTIIAVGMTYLLIAGELDLSVGANFALSTILLAILISQAGWNPYLALLAALGMGAVIGLANGLGVTFTGIPSLIWTLASLFMLQSIALMVTGGFPIDFELSGSFTSIFGGYVGPVSVHIFWAVGIIIVGAWLLARTRFGYHVYATGGNKEAAERAGVNTRLVKVICFVITGILASFTGVLLIALVQSGNPSTGTGYELQVIAAVVIGGTNLFGGSGSVVGTVIGAAILALIADGLILLGISVFAQQFVTGLIIIIAVFLDIQLRRRILRFVR